MPPKYLLIAGLLFSAATAWSQHTGKELHCRWRFASPDSMVWRSANVPGCVHTDLLRNGVIADPFAGSNELKCAWVERCEWVYETEPFEVDEETSRKKNVILRFKGLDTFAEVYLNGKLLLQADNAFRTWEADVKKLLRPHNVLLIRFKPARAMGSRLADALDYPLPGNAAMACVRRPHYQWGWDWAPALVTCGITAPIELVAWDDLRIEDLYIEQESVNAQRAKLMIEAEVHTARKGIYEATVSWHIKGSTEWHKEVFATHIARKGRVRVRVPVEIPGPQLWWCHELGEPSRYEFRIELRDAATGIISDARETTTGLRTIELVTAPDEWGESFYFRLNGLPVFAKGANYVPAAYFSHQSGNEEYLPLLTACRDAHMNMLRVWGGGVYEDDIFYQLCDSLGLMVWHDFMFACTMYPGTRSFLENVREEAHEQVRRLRNHPCMALWCGNNEVSEGWHRWGWQEGLSESQREKLEHAYATLFNVTLPQEVALHSHLPYHESSPRYGRGDSRYINEGDAHNWWVWHDGAPFESLLRDVPRFMSEFGMQSFPSAGVLRMMNEGITPEEVNETLALHQKHPRGFQLMAQYIKNWFPDFEPQSMGQFAYMTQWVQAEGIGMGLEAQRRAMPRCMGSLVWQLNDVWPAFSWSAIDVAGQPKLLYEKMKSVLRPSLITAAIEHDTLQVFWISDTTRTPFEARIALWFEGLSSEPLERDVRLHSNVQLIYETALGSCQAPAMAAAALITESGICESYTTILQHSKALDAIHKPWHILLWDEETRSARLKPWIPLQLPAP